MKAECFVFAYGSMLNPASLAKSLPHIDYGGVRPVWLDGFERSWSAIFRIASHSTTPPKIVPIAFLNVMPAYNKKIIGALIPLGADDLATLDSREYGYQRVDVTRAISPFPHAPVYVYSMAVSSTLYPRAMVAANYLRIVNDGLDRWGTQFTEDFRRTTEPNPYPVIEGDYHFLDDTQNKLTGHKSPEE